MKYKRVFLIVLDSFGIGNAPDAEKFNDLGANTLKSISQSLNFNISNLKKFGLCNIDGVELEKHYSPIAKFAALQELSNGKDTTIGHFEIAGIISEKPFPTYPEGFPDEIKDIAGAVFNKKQENI
jgi:phosphopentomutase